MIDEIIVAALCIFLLLSSTTTYCISYLSLFHLSFVPLKKPSCLSLCSSIASIFSPPHFNGLSGLPLLDQDKPYPKSSQPQMQSTTTSSTARPYSPSNKASRRRSSVADQKISLDDISTCDDEPLRRSSAFLEVGLGGDDPIVDAKLRREARPKLSVRFRSKVEIVEPEAIDDCGTSHYAHPSPRREMPFFFPTFPRLLFLVLVIVLIVPSLHTSPLLQVDANPVQPRAGALEQNLRRSNALRGIPHNKRADTSTTICKRWSQQSALVNGTLYLYSGRSTTSASQNSDTWSA